MHGAGIFEAQIRDVDEALAEYLGAFDEPASHYNILRYQLGRSGRPTV